MDASTDADAGGDVMPANERSELLQRCHGAFCGDYVELRAEVERLREALEHVHEYLPIIDTVKGRTAIAGVVREALDAS